MAVSSKIKIMISSRCNDVFPVGVSGRSLSEIRKDLKREIEGTKLFDQDIFEVWINEETPPKAAGWTSEEVCLEAVRDCDILISLYNGHAGWATTSSDIGICHAELMTGVNQASGKVRLISLGDITITTDLIEKQRNLKFTEFVNKQRIFRGGIVNNENDLIARVKEAIFDAVFSLTRMGVNEASLGRFHSGEPLEWSRLNYLERRNEMCKVLHEAISKRPSSHEESGNLFAKLAGKDILFVVNAIPDAISVSQAKEMVGQPFLHDHEYHNMISDDQGGPVHIIACHKGATEVQAKKLLGFPDATVVDAPFGIFVADDIQKVQFVFIRECRDDSMTRHGVQLFFEWLDQSGEEDLLAKRAESRAKIIKTIAEELK
jgi:hypothetical protein